MSAASPFGTKENTSISDRISANFNNVAPFNKATHNISFSFDFLGCRFKGQTREGHHGPILQIAAEIGKLPYSAEDAPLRRQIQALLLQSRALPHCRLAVATSQSLYCIAKIGISQPSTLIDLVSLSCSLMLETIPHLRALREILPSPYPSVTG